MVNGVEGLTNRSREENEWSIINLKKHTNQLIYYMNERKKFSRNISLAHLTRWNYRAKKKGSDHKKYTTFSYRILWPCNDI